ncbi:hypothetical protein BDV29DRAFT_176952 [Aspergillus leporis]|uniref:Uncharacterized protein n=1 Tax=Aspergillus leporis TaxID=41062 RepID=A0A5N5WZY7_9EURO|nr:hypothetical protein BDV29DRAFT_176952 [Aspergillus leporis]
MIARPPDSCIAFPSISGGRLSFAPEMSGICPIGGWLFATSDSPITGDLLLILCRRRNHSKTTIRMTAKGIAIPTPAFAPRRKTRRRTCYFRCFRCCFRCVVVGGTSVCEPVREVSVASPVVVTIVRCGLDQYSVSISKMVIVSVSDTPIPDTVAIASLEGDNHVLPSMKSRILRHIVGENRLALH